MKHLNKLVKIKRVMESNGEWNPIRIFYTEFLKFVLQA